MQAFHILRTRQENFFMYDFEKLVALISALKWREKNGEIKLVTDKRGADYLEQCGISEAWNEIEISLDEMDSLNWDEKIFWAGAKIFALSKQNAPVVMIDLDFIVWQHLDFQSYGKNIAVIHREKVGNFVYPGKEFFRFKDGRNFPAALNWSVEACNTAFAYFGANDIIKKYSDFAFEFMAEIDTSNGELAHMVFIEQRWLAMCAALMNREIFALSSMQELFGGRQKYFTHIWGEKQKLRDNLQAAENFCRNCVERINNDFPDWAERLKKLDWAKKYFVEVV
ncbi:MAG: hypothetical protein IJT73_11440 [Selenomonadaceae bacterium]|nr:hypothetical protein [Selenomonadaceae bacterium]